MSPLTHPKDFCSPFLAAVAGSNLVLEVRKVRIREAKQSAVVGAGGAGEGQG